MTVAELNALAAPDAAATLGACCGSSAWVTAMVAARPFASADGLLNAADVAWRATGPADWREAFAHHPRIGERAAASADARARAWSAGEQAGVATADDAIRTELARVNREYEARFGHVFLICATGRSAAEMLASARERLGNAPGRELEVAAEEQRRITRVRLLKLLGGAEESR